MTSSPDKLEEIVSEVKTIFSTHLEKFALRKTPERYAILEEIYRRTSQYCLSGDGYAPE